MKTLRFTAFLLYSLYKKKDKNAYFLTICILTLLSFFHIFQILILTNNVDVFFEVKKMSNSNLKALTVLKFMLPIGILIYFLLPKKSFVDLKFTKEKIKKGYIILWSYIILSFALVFYFSVIKKKCSIDYYFLFQLDDIISL